MGVVHFPTTFKFSQTQPMTPKLTQLQSPLLSLLVPFKTRLLYHAQYTTSSSVEMKTCVHDQLHRGDRIIHKWVGLIRAVFPGGSWWDNELEEEEEEVGSSANSTAESVTVLNALNEMWVLMGDDKWILYIAFAALTVASLSEISIPSILAQSIFSAQYGESSVFFLNARLLVILCFTSGICSGLRSGCFAMANVILVKRFRETLYTSLLFQDISFFDAEAVGDLTSRISADCQHLSHVISNDIHLILRNAVQGTGAFINLIILSWPLALSSLVICSILSGTFLAYSRFLKKAATRTQDFTASINKVADRTLSSMRTIRAYGTEMEELQRFTKWLSRLASVAIQESVAFGFWSFSFSTLYRLTQVLAILLGGMYMLKLQMSAEKLTKYVLYCEWLIYAAWRLQNNISSLLQSVGACEKVFQLMHLPLSHQFLSKGVTPQETKGIKFVNVSFRYSLREEATILQNVNFSIQSNEVTAIVGVSGAGKSTLVNLLLRLYEPSSGQIYIDDIPLRELDIRWLRENVGFVEQEPHIFHMDVKSNLSYGCTRIITQEEMELAAKKAYAHEFISALPSGYNTIVDDNLLSGGQKQRIAIARALLRDPAILVLDEATSALDAESEYYITEILRSLKKDVMRSRTVIIIAHRMSTLKIADRIFVMTAGQVVEIDGREEFLRSDGLYSQLLKIQIDEHD